MRSYRYPNEQWVLALTIFAILIIALLTAWFSLCLIPLFVLLMIILVYWSNRSTHDSLIRQSITVSQEKTPRLVPVINTCLRRLQPGSPVEFFIVPNRKLNAYTFGLPKPKEVVLHSALFEVMDEDELKFVIGHELGHVALGHSWLNTLVGGMAGIPLPFGAAVVLTLAFRWWNRLCEYSADRAGLLACGSLNKAITALVKLVNVDINTSGKLQNALQVIEKEDDSVINILAESVSTHPMMARRIDQLRHFAATPQYLGLRSQIN